MHVLSDLAQRYAFISTHRFPRDIFRFAREANSETTFRRRRRTPTPTSLRRSPTTVDESRLLFAMARRHGSSPMGGDEEQSGVQWEEEEPDYMEDLSLFVPGYDKSKLAPPQVNNLVN